MKPDPRVDAYIAKAPAFAQPLLKEVRKRIHQACPDVTETIKWNVPFYELSGRLVASMAAFKKHAKFGIWQDMRPEMLDVTTLSELPSAAEYAKKLKAAAAHARSVGAPASKAPANPAAPKKTLTKKTLAKKPALKGASVKKPRTKK